jgi:hypothetical protein
VRCACDIFGQRIKQGRFAGTWQANDAKFHLTAPGLVLFKIDGRFPILHMKAQKG